MSEPDRTQSLVTSLARPRFAHQLAKRLAGIAVLEYRPTETPPLLSAMLLDFGGLCRPYCLARRHTGANPGLFQERRRNLEETDSPLEGDGFEPSVPRRNKLCVAPATNVPGRDDPLRREPGSGCKAELGSTDNVTQSEISADQGMAKLSLAPQMPKMMTAGRTRERAC